ncbi:MAG: right-handed parallel beta-helix repeat-containing protein [Eubacterium sp.]|nr:right-handed parallel beta-helix repeat-containing protein [Eubacterium sp.]
MKRTIIAVLMALTVVFASVSVASAATSDPTTGPDNKVLTVYSIEELRTTIIGMEDAVGYTVKLAYNEQGFDLDESLDISEGITVDFDGNTIRNTSGSTYAVRLSKDGASVTNGTIIEGGIVVDCDDSNGSITKMTLKKPLGYAINVDSAGIGDIAGNTITGCKDHGIHVWYDGKTGDIKNNTITDCKGHGITVYRGSHVGNITKNKLKNIGGRYYDDYGDYGITINANDGSETYAKSITYNTVENVKNAGIVVFSKKKGTSGTAGRYKGYVKGDIANNTVKYAGTVAKNVDFGKSAKVENQGSIYVDSYAVVKGNIHHNKIYNSYVDGINVIMGSKVKSIYNNTISKAGYGGISVKTESVVSGDIKNNTVKAARYQGIFINSSSKVKGKIAKNKIVSSKQNGIFVCKKALANNVTGNTITNAKLYGVITSEGGKINTLKGNTISTTDAKNGISIIANTKTYIGKITGNKISGKYSCGIRVKSPTKKMYVTSNVLKCGNPKGKRSSGVSVEFARKGIVIKKNKITGNGTGIGIFTKSSKASVSGNKLVKTGGKIGRA